LEKVPINGTRALPSEHFGRPEKRRPANELFSN
jgi:hypothetical protein